MPMLRKLATIATAAEAARRYAKKNPDKAAQYLDQAAAFVDKQTKGRYTAQIDGVAQKVKGVAGVRSTPGATTNGHPQGAASTGTVRPTPTPGAGTSGPTTPVTPSTTSTSSAPTTPTPRPAGGPTA
jgi:antitoxin protein of toxin-antitoxin system